MKTVLAVAVLVFVSQGPRRSVSSAGSEPSDEDGVFDLSWFNLVSHQGEGHQSPEEQESQNNCTWCELVMEMLDQIPGNNRTEGTQKMIDELDFKRDKIVGIQKALQFADINKDNEIDFYEWEHSLKSRGYTLFEIEIMFAKYDHDGDDILGESERRQMLADVVGQKASVEADLVQVCDLLPFYLTKKCTEFVNSDGPLIIDLFVQELILRQFCTALGLCTSGKILGGMDGTVSISPANGG